MLVQPKGREPIGEESSWHADQPQTAVDDSTLPDSRVHYAFATFVYRRGLLSDTSKVIRIEEHKPSPVGDMLYDVMYH